MDKVIFYPNPNGSVSMISPFLECGLTLEQIAQKDTPAGLPYIIVDRADVPQDELFFNAWEADFSNPHGYGIGHEAWFAQVAQQGGQS